MLLAEDYMEWVKITFDKHYNKIEVYNSMGKYVFSLNDNTCIKRCNFAFMDINRREDANSFIASIVRCHVRK